MHQYRFQQLSRIGTLIFLMIIFVATLLCIISFTAGWMIPRVIKMSHDDRVALTYGLGMNNNGTGLVLASAAMGNHPLIMLPIIFYNLGQQIVAGVFNSKLNKLDSAGN